MNKKFIWLLIAILGIASCSPLLNPSQQPTTNQVQTLNYQASGRIKVQNTNQSINGKCLIRSTAEAWQLFIYSNFDQLLVSAYLDKNLLIIDDYYNKQQTVFDLTIEKSALLPLDLNQIRAALFGNFKAVDENWYQPNQQKYIIWEPTPEIFIKLDNFNLVKSILMPYHLQLINDQGSWNIVISKLQLGLDLTIKMPPIKQFNE